MIGYNCFETDSLATDKLTVVFWVVTLILVGGHTSVNFSIDCLHVWLYNIDSLIRQLSMFGFWVVTRCQLPLLSFLQMEALRSSEISTYKSTWR